MDDGDNLVLRMLQEMRKETAAGFAGVRAEMAEGFAKVDARLASMETWLDTLSFRVGYLHGVILKTHGLPEDPFRVSVTTKGEGA